MAIMFCEHCNDNPCSCGKIYQDTTTPQLITVLLGIEKILKARKFVPNFTIDNRPLAEQYQQLKTTGTELTTTELIETVSSEQWPVSFIDFLRKHKTVAAAQLALPTSNLRGKTILWMLLYFKTIPDPLRTYFTIILPNIITEIFANLSPLFQKGLIDYLVDPVATKRYQNIHQFIEGISTSCDPLYKPQYEVIKDLCLLDTDTSIMVIMMRLINTLAMNPPEAYVDLDAYLTTESFSMFFLISVENQIMKTLLLEERVKRF